MLEKGGMSAASETGRRALKAGWAPREPARLPHSPSPPEETGRAGAPEGTLEGVCRDVL